MSPENRFEPMPPFGQPATAAPLAVRPSPHLLPAVLLWAIFFCVTPLPAQGQDLVVLTHDLTGQAETDPNTGELHGIAHAGKRAFNLETVHEIMKAVGLKARIREVSFAQGMEALANRPDTAFFNVYRTPQREARFKWVGPLQREVDYLYGLKGNDFGNLAETRSALSICAVNGSQHHTVLLEHGYDNVVAAPTYLDCFKRLKAGTVTLAVSSDETLLQKLHAADIPVANIRRVSEPLVQSAGYIAFSPQVDDAIIHRWQNALNGLISSGRLQALYDRYYER